jgi:hypothetical protein
VPENDGENVSSPQKWAGAKHDRSARLTCQNYQVLSCKNYQVTPRGVHRKAPHNGLRMCSDMSAARAPPRRSRRQRSLRQQRTRIFRRCGLVCSFSPGQKKVAGRHSGETAACEGGWTAEWVTAAACGPCSAAGAGAAATVRRELGSRLLEPMTAIQRTTLEQPVLDGSIADFVQLTDHTTCAILRSAIRSALSLRLLQPCPRHP